MLELLLNPTLWFPVSILVAVIAVVAIFGTRSRRGALTRVELFAALNLFYGLVIGVMALGHLLAVTIKGVLGTLSRPISWVLYPLGFALAVPAWWLVVNVRRLLGDENAARSRSVALNVWLAVTFMVLGPVNFPLAIPAVLNVAYRYHSRRAVGSTILGAAIVLYLVLFVVSLVVAARR